MQKPKSLPPVDEATLERLIEQAETLNALPIDPEYRALVKEQLKTVTNAARILLEFPLDDEAEPAPVFRA